MNYWFGMTLALLLIHFASYLFLIGYLIWTLVPA